MAPTPVSKLSGIGLGPVRLVGLPDSVVIEVGDVSDEPPVLRHADDVAESGRGLFLVQELAARWGSYRTAGGKVVGAEPVARPPLPRRQASGRSAAGPAVRPDAAFLKRVLVGLDTAL